MPSELAANAAQHSRSRLPHGTFTVRAIISPDHYAWIEVQDNGGPWNQGTMAQAPPLTLIFHGKDAAAIGRTGEETRRFDT